MAHYIIGGIVFFISGDNIYSWYVNRYNEHLLNETVEKGNQPDVGVKEGNQIPWVVIVKRLKKILQPYEDQLFYHVICGEYGTGKTTLIKLAAKEVGMGVIYIDVPSVFEKFAEEFANAINFSFEKHISYSVQLMRKILGDTNSKLIVTIYC